MRMLVNLAVTVISNAIGLLVAALLLQRDTDANGLPTGDGMSLPASGFFIALAIFTVAMFLIQPAIQKAALKNANILGGSSALLATLGALIITSLLGDNLTIVGLVTWVLATVIVWLMSVLGAVFIPWLLARRAIARATAGGTPAR